MKNPVEFVLEKYNGKRTRFECPNCGKQGEFTRYIHPLTGERLPKQVGICNRRDKCGYFYSNWDFMKDNPNNWEKEQEIITVQKPKRNHSCIEGKILVASLKDYHQNNLYSFLTNLLGEQAAYSLFKLYLVGTSSNWEGANVFWQVDYYNKIRAGKVMLYHPETGKRIHKKQDWVHHLLGLENFELGQCLFGEHLLADSKKSDLPIAIVESEKTAIIASHFTEEIIWLATGGLQMLNPGTSPERFSCLKGRRVILYPDLSLPNKFNGNTPYIEWAKKAELLRNQGVKVTVSELLERNSSETERANGFDIADYLIKEAMCQSYIKKV